MLDLKAKLAAAGLVSQADIAAAERRQKPKQPAKPTGPHEPAAQQQPHKPPPGKGSGLDLPALRKASKGDCYDAIRRVVDRARLDNHAIPPEGAEPFHFTTFRGGLSRLVILPDLHRGLQTGELGITAFMSHHGLAHAVVPRPLAEAIAELFPLWLRTLHGHPGAGQLEPKPEPKKPEDPAAAAPEKAPDPSAENPDT